LNELVSKLLKYKQQAIFSNPENIAIDAAHGVAFHRGLGSQITPTETAPFEKYLSADAVAEYAQSAYAKSNVALVASGPNAADVNKWVGQFFKDLPSGGASSQYKVLPSEATKYYGGQQRLPSKAGNAVVIAFPGSSAFGTSGYKPEASVLAALLGGESTIKWSPGFSLLSQATQGFSSLRVSTKNHAYSDAGLFTVMLSGKADQVGAASKNVVDVLKKAAAGQIASEEIKKAAALAKFRALESVQTLETGLEATGSGLVHGSKPYQIDEVAKALENVTEQQVKEVCLNRQFGFLYYHTNCLSAGGQVLPLRQGHPRQRRRCLPAPLRRGPGSDRLNPVYNTQPLDLRGKNQCPPLLGFDVNTCT
jgi:ubiquinol-cytochrome c reductase core subunit 2